MSNSPSQGAQEPPAVPPEPVCQCGHLLKEHVMPMQREWEPSPTIRCCARCACTLESNPAPSTDQAREARR